MLSAARLNDRKSDQHKEVRDQRQKQVRFSGASRGGQEVLESKVIWCQEFRADQSQGY